eukprot:COSAG01_NODE_48989_length_376_cov_0.696751_1_plen_40_part_01
MPPGPFSWDFISTRGVAKVNFLSITQNRTNFPESPLTGWL